MSRIHRAAGPSVPAALALCLCLLPACDGAEETGGAAGAAGSAGSAGNAVAGSAGSAGAAGSGAGSAGAASGGAGNGGVGSGGAGNGGAGNGGVAGSGGAAAAGAGGASAGGAGGGAGTAGSGAGTAGSGGAGSGGTSAGGAGAGTGGTANGGGTFILTSPAFDEVAGCSETNASVCDTFPTENISYMESPNISPKLDWTGVPAGTKSFAVTLYDLSYAQPHWAIWNISADLTGLPPDIAKDTTMPAVPAGSQQSTATFAEGDGYFGPQSPCNVYRFELYALSTETFTPSMPDYAAVVWNELQALGPELLGRATLTGRSNYMMMCE